jgi:hypothetical protein
MPTFCRHNRFIERCPICSRTLPDAPASASSPRPKSSKRPRAGGARAASGRVRGEGVRIQREGRTADDGYRSALVPGLRASADAQRLVEEIGFSCGRLLALAATSSSICASSSEMDDDAQMDPPALYGEIRTLAGSDLEAATWACFLTAYLCPLDGEDPFAGIRHALAAGAEATVDLDGVALGPRTSHDTARGPDTLLAYRQWVARTGGANTLAPNGARELPGPQAVAFTGDPAWTPQRRFERLFERLALPGFSRSGRYELLVLLGRLDLYELSAASLQLTGAGGLSAEDSTTLAAKRVFGIGDPLLLERRAAALAEASSIPIEALDLALANWLSPQRTTLGFPPETREDDALARAGEALGL